MMDRLVERATLCGIEAEYRDAFGHLRTVEPEVLARLVEVLQTDDHGIERMLPRTVVLRGHGDRSVVLPASEALRLSWEIFSDSDRSIAQGEIDQAEIAKGEGRAPVITLPPDLANGVFRLRITVTSPARRVEDATLICCPRRASQGGKNAPARMWALAAQLYGVRSARNWGHGDFSDLAALIDLAADCGASAVGLNPLHALFDDHAEDASPYSPNSRLFLNPLYIDVEAVPEFPGVEAAGLIDAIAQARSKDIVDYVRVADAKTRALRVAHDRFCQDGHADRRLRFLKFRKARGSGLSAFACFELLRRRFGRPWWDWPEQWRRADDAALDALRRSEETDVGFFEFVQWVAHEQLELCRERAHARAMPIGLYLDIAVGVRSDGFDAWRDQDAVISGMAVGAPPDIMNTRGQNWGLAGFNPVGLENRQLQPFGLMLQSSMRYAGAIRLDHVLGLKRLYMIPAGKPPKNGAYIRFPFEPLLAIATLRSVDNECIVVGEDLGTVPEKFRETLADWGIWSYQVMLFERWGQGDFSPPEKYRENALVAFGTHDIATFAGWRDQRDLVVKRALDIDPGETSEERDRAVDALRRALAMRGDEAAEFSSVARHLADAPSRLLVIAMEDLLGIVDQVNLPGTVNEHPNWRQRLPVMLEDLKDHQGLTTIVDLMRTAGRGFPAS
jgi:4-alpha-glucanotransferase